MLQSCFALRSYCNPCWSCCTLYNCLRWKSCIVQVEDSRCDANILTDVVKLAKRIELPDSATNRKETKIKQMQSNEATHKHVSKLEYDNSKAGLQKVNKAEVQRVIEETSRGSAFYESERRREELRKERNQIILQKAKEFEMLVESSQQVRKRGNSSITKEEKEKQREKLEQLKEIKERVRKCISELERERDLTKRYVHIDMDMFYAAVEERRDPTLRNRPFAVGSFSMLCTSNYIARQYGVRSGMPGFIAKKLCPELWIIPPDFTTYTQIAKAVRTIAKEYDPQYISVGLDELTMDVTDYLQKHPELTVSAVCESFRRKVFTRTHLTCSGGIAPTAALAKIASNVNKPNGQHEVVLRSRAEVIKYISTIPIRQIPGIGFAQESLLNALGVTYCKHFLQKKELMCYLFKEKTFAFYLSIGLGLVRTRVDRALNERKRVKRKSIHKERTISHRIRSSQEACSIVESLFDQAYETLLTEHAHCRCVVLVVKTRTFDLHSTQRTLTSRSNDRVVLWRAIMELLEPVMINYSEYRLLGVSFHDLSFEKQKKKCARAHVQMEKEKLQEKLTEASSSTSTGKTGKANSNAKKLNTKRTKTAQNKVSNKKPKSKVESAKKSTIFLV